MNHVRRDMAKTEHFAFICVYVKKKKKLENGKMQKEKQGRCSSVSSPPVQQVSVRQSRIRRPSAAVFLFLLVLPSEGRTEEQLHLIPSGFLLVAGRSFVDVLVHAVVQQWRRRQLPAARVLELEQVSDLADHTQRLHTHTRTHKQMCHCERGGGGERCLEVCEPPAK